VAETRKSSGLNRPGGDVNRRASEIPTADLTLTSVKTCSDTDAEQARRLDPGGRAPDSPRRTIEARNETYTCGLDLPPTEPAQHFAHGPVV
jgi:hypothetical protein